MAARAPSRSVNVPGRAAARTTCVAALLVLGMAIVAGAVRILPWLVAPDVPWRVALPFARALLAVAMETALLCAAPVGWALSAARLVERGEARALFAIGISPGGVVRRTLPYAAGYALLAGAAALAWGTEAAAPGRMVRAMVQQSRRSCEVTTSPRALHVPFVGATWLCASPAPVRVFGSLPGGAGHFTAEDLTVSDDLAAIELADARIMLGAPVVHLHVAQTKVVGLTPWGRASNLAPQTRSLLVSFTGACLALLVAWLVVQRANGSRVVALLMGAAGPVAALVTMTHLEASAHGPLAYAWVAVAGASGLLAAHALDRALSGRRRRAVG